MEPNPSACAHCWTARRGEGGNESISLRAEVCVGQPDCAIDDGDVVRPSFGGSVQHLANDLAAPGVGLSQFVAPAMPRAGTGRSARRRANGSPDADGCTRCPLTKTTLS